MMMKCKRVLRCTFWGSSLRWFVVHLIFPFSYWSRGAVVEAVSVYHAQHHSPLPHQLDQVRRVCCYFKKAKPVFARVVIYLRLFCLIINMKSQRHSLLLLIILPQTTSVCSIIEIYYEYTILIRVLIIIVTIFSIVDGYVSITSLSWVLTCTAHSSHYWALWRSTGTLWSVSVLVTYDTGRTAPVHWETETSFTDLPYTWSQ